MVEGAAPGTGPSVTPLRGAPPPHDFVTGRIYFFSINPTTAARCDGSRTDCASHAMPGSNSSGISR